MSSPTPQLPPSNGTTGVRAVGAYVGLIRVSSDQQETSAEDQDREIRSWGLANGGTLVREPFVDDGVTGSDLDRPGLRDLFAFVERSAVRGTVVAWKRSRLARPEDPRDGLFLERRIEKAGWKLHYLQGTPASGNPLVDTITAVIEHHTNGEYLRSLSQDTLRGQLHRVLSGELPGGKTPYGFGKVLLDEAGTVVRRLSRTERHRKLKRERGRLVEGDPLEIDTVRFIFAEYSSGQSGFSRIAKKLNDRRVPSPSGGQWLMSTIREILLNPAYVGDLVWNKETTALFCRLVGKSPTKTTTAHTSRRSGKKIHFAENAPEDWVRVEKHHPPLIDRAIFDRAATVMKSRAREGGGGRVTYTYPLSGLVVCGSCGSPMNGWTRKVDGHTYRDYVCSSYFKHKACAPNTIRAENFQATILRHMRGDLLAQARERMPAFRAKVLEILRASVSSSVPTLDLARLTRERASLESKIKTAVGNMGLLAGEAAKRLAGQIDEWAKSQAEIDRRLAELQAQKALEIDLERAADEIVGAVAKLDTEIETLPPEEQKAFFRGLVDNVEVRFVTEPATGERKRARHRFVGATVHGNALLGIASRALGCNQASLPG